MEIDTALGFVLEVIMIMRVYAPRFSLVLLVVVPIRGVVDLLVWCYRLVRCRCVFVSSDDVLRGIILGCSFFPAWPGGFRVAGRLVRAATSPSSAISYVFS